MSKMSELARAELHRELSPDPGATEAELSLEALARENPTGYRLLYVMRSWADYIGTRPNQNRLARVLPMIVPHMANDIATVPEGSLRLGLAQIREAIDAILDGEAAAPAPPTGQAVPADDADAPGADAQAG